MPQRGGGREKRPVAAGWQRQLAYDLTGLQPVNEAMNPFTFRQYVIDAFLRHDTTGKSSIVLDGILGHSILAHPNGSLYVTAVAIGGKVKDTLYALCENKIWKRKIQQHATGAWSPWTKVAPMKL